MPAGPRLSWLRALVVSTTIIQGAPYIENPIRCLLSPCAGQCVDIAFNDPTPTSPTVFNCPHFKNTFEATEELDYAVALEINTDAGSVLFSFLVGRCHTVQSLSVYTYAIMP